MAQEVTALCFVQSLQMNDTEPGSAAIKHFVREQLGCACPDEVFESIRLIEHGCISDLSSTVYDIGGRLLVAVLTPVNWHEITKRLGQLVDAGKQYRDQHGYNRFRLVIVTDNDDAAHRLQLVFDGLPNIDEKTHLHVIKPDVLPSSISPGC